MAPLELILPALEPMVALAERVMFLIQPSVTLVLV
jgi:hypothetical protein